MLSSLLMPLEIEQRLAIEQEIYEKYSNQLHHRLLKTVSDSVRYWHETELDPRVAKAILTVPRHHHVPPEHAFPKVYRNTILNIEDWMARERFEKEARIRSNQKRLNKKQQGILNALREEHDATASEPGLVAYMTHLVMPPAHKTDAVALDIGCGFGYQTAILRASGFSHVTGIDRKPHLAQGAKLILQEDSEVTILQGDGKNGIPGQEFDAIVVAAQASKQDTLSVLLTQLKPGGKLVMPMDAQALGDLFPVVNEALENGVSPTAGILVSAVKEQGGTRISRNGRVTFVRLV